MNRILNAEELVSHGNRKGRRAVLEILEAGLAAADPYNNALRLLRRSGERLFIGAADFEPKGSPFSGDEVIDLRSVGRVIVVGAAKGVQRIAKAIEEVLGDRLTGGHVIDKIGAPVILDRIGVSLGGHPVPDEGCVEGCRRIVGLLKDLRQEDLVFTIAGNGISSLLTLPMPGLSLEDVRRTTYALQIGHGLHTVDLNQIRNNIDVLKGGRISRLLQPARAIHIIAIDPNKFTIGEGSYEMLMHRNRWIHTLPDATSAPAAIETLKKHNAWDAVPQSVREHLLRSGPSEAGMRYDEFEKTRYRIFGIMPDKSGMMPAAMAKARELDLAPHLLCSWLLGEAAHMGNAVARIALSIEKDGAPFAPPCALFTTGELLVTVGNATGIGGRNQEFALSAAQTLAGSKRVVMGSVDTDGNDGPGTQFHQSGLDIPTLAGGIVDGWTAAEALAAQVDIRAELERHNSTPALWKLNCGVHATHNISLTDLGVTVILKRDG